MKRIDRSYDLFRVLKSIKESIRQNFEGQMKDFRMTGPQGMLIGILVHGGPTKVSDISEKMCLSNSTVSSIIDRLEKQKYVERIRSQEDRRVVMIDLTADFRKQAEERFHQMESLLESAMSIATPEESAKIVEGLTLLDEVLKRSRGQSSESMNEAKREEIPSNDEVATRTNK